jgi:hypothetical protein
MNVWLSLPLQLGTGGRRNKLFTDVLAKGNEQYDVVVVVLQYGTGSR